MVWRPGRAQRGTRRRCGVWGGGGAAVGECRRALVQSVPQAAAELALALLRLPQDGCEELLAVDFGPSMGENNLRLKGARGVSPDPDLVLPLPRAFEPICRQNLPNLTEAGRQRYLNQVPGS